MQLYISPTPRVRPSPLFFATVAAGERVEVRLPDGAAITGTLCELPFI